jgi:tRNA(Ile)-lysidine synthase TilS/MesJ
MADSLERHIIQRIRVASKRYGLIEDGDRILVGLSGGKDSLCMLEMLARQSRIRKPSFSVEAIHVRMKGVQYEADSSYLDTFCAQWDVPLHVCSTAITSSDSTSKPMCFLCSWNRRKQLFNYAQDHGFNKIALGHHQDDIIHTALMNLTFQGHFSTMPAKLRMRKMPLTMIRPLCLCQEDDILEYARQQDYQKLIKLCPHERETNRTSIQQLYSTMQQLNPEARASIWNALSADGKLIEY